MRERTNFEVDVVKSFLYSALEELNIKEDEILEEKLARIKGIEAGKEELARGLSFIERLEKIEAYDREARYTIFLKTLEADEEIADIQREIEIRAKKNQAVVNVIRQLIKQVTECAPKE